MKINIPPTVIKLPLSGHDSADKNINVRNNIRLDLTSPSGSLLRCNKTIVLLCAFYFSYCVFLHYAIYKQSTSQLDINNFYLHQIGILKNIVFDKSFAQQNLEKTFNDDLKFSFKQFLHTAQTLKLRNNKYDQSGDSSDHRKHSTSKKYNTNEKNDNINNLKDPVRKKEKSLVYLHRIKLSRFNKMLFKVYYKVINLFEKYFVTLKNKESNDLKHVEHVNNDLLNINNLLNDVYECVLNLFHTVETNKAFVYSLQFQEKKNSAIKNSDVSTSDSYDDVPGNIKLFHDLKNEKSSNLERDFKLSKIISERIEINDKNVNKQRVILDNSKTDNEINNIQMSGTGFINDSSEPIENDKTMGDIFNYYSVMKDQYNTASIQRNDRNSNDKIENNGAIIKFKQNILPVLDYHIISEVPNNSEISTEINDLKSNNSIYDSTNDIKSNTDSTNYLLSNTLNVQTSVLSDNRLFNNVSEHRAVHRVTRDTSRLSEQNDTKGNKDNKRNRKKYNNSTSKVNIKKRNKSRCCKKYVSILLKGATPTAAIRDGGVIGPWYFDMRANGERNDFNNHFVLQEMNRKIQIKKGGLYIVYAQIYYTSSEQISNYSDTINSYSINVANSLTDRPIAVCSVHSSVNYTSEVSCHVSIVYHLNPQDRVFLVQREPNRKILLKDGYSYFGLSALRVD